MNRIVLICDAREAGRLQSALLRLAGCCIVHLREQDNLDEIKATDLEEFKISACEEKMPNLQVGFDDEYLQQEREWSKAPRPKAIRPIAKNRSRWIDVPYG